MFAQEPEQIAETIADWLAAGLQALAWLENWIVSTRAGADSAHISCFASGHDHIMMSCSMNSLVFSYEPGFVCLALNLFCRKSMSLLCLFRAVFVFFKDFKLHRKKVIRCLAILP